MRPAAHLATLLAVAALAGCVSVPFDYPKEASTAISPSPETTLGREAAMWSDSNVGLSGFIPLTDGMEALGARLRLMEEAQVSIDAQYFLIKPDTAGVLFASGLLEAADRGVKVRFLIDDIFTPKLDSPLTTLDSHPNLEVRIFNPLSRQSARYWSLLVDFKRANRRMHNKSFTVDNSITIVGGRNIAAEYFQIDDSVEFMDFEMAGIGPVAEEVSATFDLFWNSELAVPVAAFADNVSAEELEKLRSTATAEELEAELSVYNEAIASEFLENIQNRLLIPTPARTTVVSDNPTKLTTTTKDQDSKKLVRVLAEFGDAAQDEIFIITPYFVPEKSGVEMLAAHVARGVRVKVLTNSLASTNHVPVHSGYARYRKRLLEAGIELYELKHDSILVLDNGEEEDIRATLHTKAMIFDRETLFVGSLNFDPRSIDINTEMGIFVHSPEIANGFARHINEDLSLHTYRVVLDDSKLRWRHEYGDQLEVATKEPQSGFWRRFSAGFYRILPIEGQL